MFFFRSCVVAVLAAAFLPAANAEVTDAASNGFSIRHIMRVSIAREELYRIAIDNVGEWWNADHTVSGNAANLYIEARPLGCFCEKIGDQGGLVHLTVTFVNPNVVIRLSGGLGPLGLMGVSGNMTWEFEDSDDGSILTLNYSVGGYVEGGLDELAGAVDGVLVEQMSRLKSFAESRKPG
jgi:hypothetical protein